MGSTQQQQSLGGQEVGSRAAVIGALLLGNFALAFGPWLVRMADVGPSASAMWRLALAAPVLFLIAAYRRQPLTLPNNALYWTMLLSGLFFAVDLAAWHIGILKTKMANATLFANAASLFFPIWGFLVARAWPTRPMPRGFGSKVCPSDASASRTSCDSANSSHAITSGVHW